MKMPFRKYNIILSGVIFLLFIIIFILAMYLQMHKNRKIHFILRQNGCTCIYGYEYDFTIQNGRIPNWTQPKKKCFSLYGDDRDIVYVGISNKKDEDLAAVIKLISNLPSLQHILITNCTFGIKSQKELVLCKNLKVLSIDQSALENFSSFKQQYYPTLILHIVSKH